jgi:predicted nucleotidyltransferase
VAPSRNGNVRGEDRFGDLREETTVSLLIPTATTPLSKHPVLEAALNAARTRIQVSEEELIEARSRRDRMLDALKREFGGRTYVNGSVAHGDALNPLTDIDLGIVIPNEMGLYGPGLRGPAELQERAAAALRQELAGDYSNLRIEWRSRRRSVLVRFGDPVTPGQKDFTADVITAIDFPGGDGLYIPRHDGWDRSAPETHTQMVRDRNKLTTSRYARVVRLVKHWARTHDRPLCSWNIKALALGAIYSEVTMLDGLRNWFDHAVVELGRGETEDPAGVAAEPIHIPEKWAMSEVLAELRDAGRRLTRAVRFEEEGYPAMALDELAKVFRDPQMLPGPDARSLAADMARHAAATVAPGVVPLGTTAEHPTFPRRAWGE